MGCVLPRGNFQRGVVVIPEQGFVVRVGAVFDEQFGSLARDLPAEVGYALLGYDDLYVVLGLVHVRDHGDYAGDEALLRGGLRCKYAYPRVPRKVAAAADAVHHLGAHGVRGVHVAVDVHLHGGVQGDDAQAADNLRVVGYLLGTDEHLVLEIVDVVIEAAAVLFGECYRAGGDEVEHALLDEVQRRVLHDLGVHHEVPEPALGEAAEHGVAH